VSPGFGCSTAASATNAIFTHRIAEADRTVTDFIREIVNINRNTAGFNCNNAECNHDIASVTIEFGEFYYRTHIIVKAIDDFFNIIDDVSIEVGDFFC
jgi:hypothetical protein